MRVLIVAASSMAQAGMAALIEGVAGLEVAASLGPEAAADMGAQVDPDVCLVDLERPREAEDVIGPLVTRLGCPVVAVTEVDGFAAARAAGAIGVLSPAIAASALAAALEAARHGVGVAYPPQEDVAVGGGAAPRTVEVLTPREMDVLQLLAAGLTNQGIAARLGISEHTAKFHVSAVLGKLGAQSRAEAVTQGYRRGLISV